MPVVMSVPMLLMAGHETSWKFDNYDKLLEWKNEYYLNADSVLVRNLNQFPYWRNIVAFADMKATLQPKEKRDSIKTNIMEILGMQYLGGLDTKILTTTPSYRALYDEYIEWRDKFEPRE